jgi:hypothetical protein
VLKLEDTQVGIRKRSVGQPEAEFISWDNRTFIEMSIINKQSLGILIIAVLNGSFVITPLLRDREKWFAART